MRPWSAIIRVSAALTLCPVSVGAMGAGKTVGCIKTTRIESIKPVDPQRAQFTLYNNEVYVNTFRRECAVSGFKGYGYKTPTGQLCRGNTMRAVGTGNTNTCILGSFEQVSAGAP